MRKSKHNEYIRAEAISCGVLRCYAMFAITFGTAAGVFLTSNKYVGTNYYLAAMVAVIPRSFGFVYSLVVGRRTGWRSPLRWGAILLHGLVLVGIAYVVIPLFVR